MSGIEEPNIKPTPGHANKSSHPDYRSDSSLPIIPSENDLKIFSLKGRLAFNLSGTWDSKGFPSKYAKPDAFYALPNNPFIPKAQRRVPNYVDPKMPIFSDRDSKGIQKMKDMKTYLSMGKPATRQKPPVNFRIGMTAQEILNTKANPRYQDSIQ